jgi:hypothetical protein
MRWLSELLSKTSKGLRSTSQRTKFRPEFEGLEERAVPSTTSSIAANFNPTPIPAGSTVWFNASFQAGNLPNGATVNLHVVNESISFTANGTAYNVAVPNGVIALTPGATSASTSFDPTDNDWDVSAPTGGAGNVFMGGVAVPVPSGLPGGIQNVTWTASFWSDTNNITVNWHWGAAVYKSFSTDYNALGVKPVDNNNLSVYKNGDHAGTPEAYKAFVVAGATGGGGNNFTGNSSPNKGVTPQWGDGAALYPYASSNPLTSIAFNESTVLKAATLDTTNGYFDVWYSDEHALALGVGSVVVKSAAGVSTTTNYPIASMASNPGYAVNPALGTTATSGDQAGTDVSGRPMAPSLFITDTTIDHSANSGDWQWGGSAYAPNAVFGAWKSFTRTVDYTTVTPTVTVAGAIDPVKNNWNLGPGSDAPPAGVASEGYGAEVRWNLNDLYKQGVLVAGHTYRFYVMVHDGDQNKVGGDAGQAAYNYFYPGPPASALPATLSGKVTDQSGAGVAGVLITLSGTDATGTAFSLTATTDLNGNYSFSNVAAGSNYTVTESAASLPAGYYATGAFPGTVNGTTDGTTTITTEIDTVNLNGGDSGLNYNFTIFNPATSS